MWVLTYSSKKSDLSDQDFRSLVIMNTAIELKMNQDSGCKIKQRNKAMTIAVINHSELARKSRALQNTSKNGTEVVLQKIEVLLLEEMRKGC